MFNSVPKLNKFSLMYHIQQYMWKIPAQLMLSRSTCTYTEYKRSDFWMVNIANNEGNRII